jgi:hypothetical protein
MTGSFLLNTRPVKRLTVVNQIRHAEEYAHADKAQQDHGVLEDAQDVDW